MRGLATWSKIISCLSKRMTFNRYTLNWLRIYLFDTLLINAGLIFKILLKYFAWKPSSLRCIAEESHALSRPYNNFATIHDMKIVYLKYFEILLCCQTWLRILKSCDANPSFWFNSASTLVSACKFTPKYLRQDFDVINFPGSEKICILLIVTIWSWFPSMTSGIANRSIKSKL